MAEKQGREVRSGAQPLSRQEESALAERLRDGDAVAAELLITSQLPFITAIARRYSRYGLPLNDLVQEGVVGLMQAIRRFNPAQNVRLSTYAMWWVRAAIQEHVMRSWSLVRIGTTAAQKGVFFRLRQIATEMRPGREISDAVEERLRRLATRFGTTPEELRGLARRIGARDRSLNEPCTARPGAEWIDLLPDPTPSPEERTVQASEARFWRARLCEALAALPPRERFVICRRHLAEGRLSFAAIAREMGLSKERVRQLEAQAISELRRIVSAATGGSPLAAEVGNR